MKYIDAEKLLSEIESRMEDCKLPNGTFPTTTNIVRYEELSCLHNFITSLQQEQPEVDFETEYAKFTNDPDELEYAFPIDLADYKDFALHFYELGKLSNKK